MYKVHIKQNHIDVLTANIYAKIWKKKWERYSGFKLMFKSYYSNFWVYMRKHLLVGYDKLTEQKLEDNSKMHLRAALTKSNYSNKKPYPTQKKKNLI